MPAIRRILCPVDFSEGSEQALRYAVELAKAVGASVTVLHAYETPMQWVPAGIAYDAGEPGALFDLEHQKQALRDKLEETRANAGASGVELHATLVEGPAAQTITDQAGELQADMLVMSTHGRRGLDHLLLGSVAERVVRLAKCPVLTLRMQESESASPSSKPAK